jgi:hypothetical protein
MLFLSVAAEFDFFLFILSGFVLRLILAFLFFPDNFLRFRGVHLRKTLQRLECVPGDTAGPTPGEEPDDA